MLLISGLLVPQPGTESEPPAAEAWSLNHSTPQGSLCAIYSKTELGAWELS